MGLLRNLQRPIYEFASERGLGTEFLSLADELGVKNIGYDVEVDERVRDFQLLDEEKKGHVLLPLTQGLYGSNGYRFCLFAHAFRTRGYEPVIPICYANLPFCHRNDQEDVDKPECDMCFYSGMKLLAEFGLDPNPISEILPEEYEVNIDPNLEHYKGIPVSKYAQSSTRRVQKKYNLDHEDRETYMRFLQSSVKLVDVAETLVDTYDIDATLGDHDAYIYAGIYLAVADKYDIPAYSQAVGHLDESLLVGSTDNRTPRPYYLDGEMVDEYLEKPLSETETRQIDELMKKRQAGEEMYYQYSSQTSEGVDVDGSRPLVGVFTNLVWDASFQLDQNIFPDYLEWVDRTIENVGDVNARIVIKPHPAENARGTNERVFEYIRENHPDLPENVEVLPSDTDVDTYALIDQLDAGIVFNSTVGLEMAYWDVPVIVAGDSHYNGFGFTHDPATKQEYDEYLSELTDLPHSTEMKKRARRYCHYFYFIKHLDFPYISTRDQSHATKPKPVSHDDIKPGSELFDGIVDNILSGEPVVSRNLGKQLRRHP